MHYTLAESDSLGSFKFDRVHMDSMKIDQRMRSDAKSKPVFNIELTYRMYGVEEGGRIRYSDEGLQLIVIENFIPTAEQKAAEGNTNYLETFAALERLVLEVVADQRNTTLVIS